VKVVLEIIFQIKGDRDRVDVFSVKNGGKLRREEGDSEPDGKEVLSVGGSIIYGREEVLSVVKYALVSL